MFKPIYILKKDDILEIDTSEWNKKLIVKYAVFKANIYETVKILNFNSLSRYFNIEKTLFSIKIFNPLKEIRFGVIINIDGIKYLRSYRKILINSISSLNRSF